MKTYKSPEPIINDLKDTVYFGDSPLWTAASSGDLKTIDDYYQNKGWKPNTRFHGFGNKNSLMMAAVRNKQWDAFKKLQDYGEEVLPEEMKELGDAITIRDNAHVKNFDLNKFNDIIDKIDYGRANKQSLGSIQDSLLKEYGPDYEDLVRHALSKWAE